MPLLYLAPTYDFAFNYSFMVAVFVKNSSKVLQI